MIKLENPCIPEHDGRLYDKLVKSHRLDIPYFRGCIVFRQTYVYSGNADNDGNQVWIPEYTKDSKY
jgi:hypothetical protein